MIIKRILPALTLLLIGVTLVQLWATSAPSSHPFQAIDMGGSGDAAIGGDFILTDQNGQPVRENSFRGRIMLVFFGFTHCPDICPMAVANMSKAMELLGANADKVAPIFITVDPERDTSAVLKDYLANFDKRLVGLTGTPEQIQQVTAEYKAYFSKHDIPWSQESPKEEHEHHDVNEHAHGHHEEYSVDHSGFIYMMGRDGKYLKVFPSNADPQEIAHAVESAIK